MGIETEFKFLIESLPKTNFNKTNKVHIDQIYFTGKKRINEIKIIFPEISFEKINTFRVRKIEAINVEKYIITLKTEPLDNGISRFEYEKEINEETFNLLIKDNIESEVIKNRYVDYYKGFTFEFDEYLNLARDLVTVEVEVEKVDSYDLEAKNLIDIIKNHYGLDAKDVSYSPTYKNSNLIRYFGK